MLTKIWNKLDHYSKAYLPVLGISIALILFLLLTGHFNLLPEGFLDFIPITYFAATQLSSGTAFAQLLDLYEKEADNRKKFHFWQREYWNNFKNKWEFFGTLFGISAVIITGTVLAAMFVAAALYPIISTALLMISCVNIFANYAMRLGRTLDDNNPSKPERPPIEHLSTRLGAVAGIALSATLVGLGFLTAVSVVGFTSFITGGAALPFWLGAAAFILHVSSSTSATSYYLARAKTFFTTPKFDNASGKPETIEQETLRKKHHEYRGSTVGVLAGMTIGGTVAGLLLGGIIATSIFTFGAPIAIIAAGLVITSCIAIIGGLCSRVGRLIDKVQAARKEIKREEAQSLTIENSPERSLSSTASLSSLTPPSPESRPDSISQLDSPKRISATSPLQNHSLFSYREAAVEIIKKEQEHTFLHSPLN